MGDGYGSQGRHRELLRRLRYGNQGYAGYPEAALQRDHVEGDFPPHARTVRRAFALITDRKIKSADYITGEAPLSRLQQVLHHMLNRNAQIKTAIIPGH